MARPETPDAALWELLDRLNRPDEPVNDTELDAAKAMQASLLEQGRPGIAALVAYRIERHRFYGGDPVAAAFELAAAHQLAASVNRVEPSRLRAEIHVDLATTFDRVADHQRARDQLDQASRLLGLPGSAQTVDIDGSLRDFLSGRQGAVTPSERDETAAYLLQTIALLHQSAGECEHALEVMLGIVGFYAEAQQEKLATMIADCTIKTGRLDIARQLIDRLGTSTDDDVRLAARLLHARLLLVQGDAAGAARALRAGGVEALGRTELEAARIEVASLHADAAHAAGLPAEEVAAVRSLLREHARRTAAPVGYRVQSLLAADLERHAHHAMLASAATDDREAAVTIAELVRTPTLRFVGLNAVGSALSATAGAPADPSGFGLTGSERRDISTAYEKALVTHANQLLAIGGARPDQEVVGSAWVRTRLSAAGSALALSMLWLCGHVHCVLVGPDRIEQGVVQVPQAVADNLRAYGENLHRPFPRLDELDPADLRISLSDLLPLAIVSRILGAPRLFVAAHRWLHWLPWPMMPVDADGTTRLVDHTPVTLTPSLRSVPSTAEPAEARPVLVLRGTAPPSAAQEVAELEALTGGSCIDVRDLAEDAVLAGWPDHEGILHIACHGTVDPDDPFQTRLRIGASPIGVSAAQLSAAQIRAREVVLSACSSGWRPAHVGDLELAGDDLLALPGTFLFAGAHHLVCSITPAEDAAATFFVTSYHRDRQAGAPPHIALRAAHLAASEARYPSWGRVGFVHYGAGPAADSGR